MDFSLTVANTSKDDQVLFLKVFKDDIGVLGPSDVNEAAYQATVLGTKQRLSADRADKSHSDSVFSGTVFDAADNRPVVKVDQVLWAQQLINAGLGVGLVSSSNAELADQAQIRWQLVKQRQIHLSLIAGRFDSDAYTSFIDLVRNFDWESGSERVGKEVKIPRTSSKSHAQV